MQQVVLQENTETSPLAQKLNMQLVIGLCCISQLHLQPRRRLASHGSTSRTPSQTSCFQWAVRREMILLWCAKKWVLKITSSHCKLNACCWEKLSLTSDVFLEIKPIINSLSRVLDAEIAVGGTVWVQRCRAGLYSIRAGAPVPTHLHECILETEGCSPLATPISTDGRGAPCRAHAALPCKTTLSDCFWTSALVPQAACLLSTVALPSQAPFTISRCAPHSFLANINAIKLASSDLFLSCLQLTAPHPPVGNHEQRLFCSLNFFANCWYVALLLL